MTLTADPETAGSGHPAAPRPPSRSERRAAQRAATPPPGPPPTTDPTVGAIAVTISLLVLGVLGFAAFLFGFSGLSEARQQNTALKSFSYQLGQAIAPTGPTAEGRPVAVLNAPQLGLRNAVVLEGTTSRDLTRGPGHLRSSPLPGQAGTVVVFAKRATYGAPFKHLLDLQAGDVITFSTGQAIAKYTVSSVGSTDHPAPANSANRVVLITAGSSFDPSQTVQVSADLIGSPQPSAGNLPQITRPEVALQGDSADALVPLLLWSQALLLVAISGTVGWFRWNRSATAVLLIPVTLAVLWNVYENIAALRPNLV